MKQKPGWLSFPSLSFSASNLALFSGFLAFGIFEMGKWVLLATVLVYLHSRLAEIEVPKKFRDSVLLLSLYAIVTSCYSPEIATSLMKSVALLLVLLSVLFLVSSLRFRNRETLATQISLLSWGFVVVSAFYFLTSLALLRAGVNYPPFLAAPLFTGLEEGWSVRFSGILGNPNQLGICAAVLSPIVFAKALEAPKKRYFCWLILAAICYCIWVSRSRNGLMCIVISVGTVFAFAASRRNFTNRIIVFGVVAVVGAAFASASLIDYIARDKRGDITVASIGNNRFSRWSVGIRSIEKRPVFGQGFAYGGVPKSGYIHQNAPDKGYPLHNSYLQITQEIGLIGLVLVMTLLTRTVTQSFRKREFAINTPGLRYSYAGFVGVFFSGLANAFFESWMIAPGNLGTLPFWCAVGVIHCMPDE